MLIIDPQATKVKLLHLLWCEQNCHCWMFRPVRGGSDAITLSQLTFRECFFAIFNCSYLFSLLSNY